MFRRDDPRGRFPAAGFSNLTPYLSQSDIEVVAEAENGMEAIKRCKEFGVDLVLMDLNMPDIDGIEATRRIVAEFPQIHVIVLTSHSEKRYVAETLKSGAKGYLVKENASDELVDAIHEVFLGNRELRLLSDATASGGQLGLTVWMPYSVPSRSAKSETSCLGYLLRRLTRRWFSSPASRTHA
jgi:DNA-binding NarL/FixJ family response regulator